MIEIITNKIVAYMFQCIIIITKRNSDNGKCLFNIQNY